MTYTFTPKTDYLINSEIAVFILQKQITLHGFSDCLLRLVLHTLNALGDGFHLAFFPASFSGKDFVYPLSKTTLANRRENYEEQTHLSEERGIQIYVRNT